MMGGEGGDLGRGRVSNDGSMSQSNELYNQFQFSVRNGRPRGVRGASAEEEEGRPQDVEESRN